MPEQTINFMDAIIVIVGMFLINTLPILIRIHSDSKRSDDRHDNHDTRLEALNQYICDKGVDDFNDECDRWIKKKYVTEEAYYRLKCRYKSLGDLNANGRRERHWKKLKELEKVKDK